MFEGETMTMSVMRHLEIILFMQKRSLFKADSELTFSRKTKKSSFSRQHNKHRPTDQICTQTTKTATWLILTNRTQTNHNNRLKLKDLFTAAASPCFSRTRKNATRWCRRLSTVRPFGASTATRRGWHVSTRCISLAVVARQTMSMRRERRFCEKLRPRKRNAW